MEKVKIENFEKDLDALINKYFRFIQDKGFNDFGVKVHPPQLIYECESIDYKLIISLELYSLPEVSFIDKETNNDLIRDASELIEIKEKHQRRVSVKLSKRNYIQALNQDYEQYQLYEIEQTIKIYSELIKEYLTAS